MGSALLVAGDLQLSGVLVYYLYKNRTSVRRYVLILRSILLCLSDDSVLSTNSMVDILIAYTVSSGECLRYMGSSKTHSTVAHRGTHLVRYTGPQQ